MKIIFAILTLWEVCYGYHAEALFCLAVAAVIHTIEKKNKG